MVRDNLICSTIYEPHPRFGTTGRQGKEDKSYFYPTLTNYTDKGFQGLTPGSFFFPIVGSDVQRSDVHSAPPSCSRYLPPEINTGVEAGFLTVNVHH